jgi:predicted secreted protein
MCRYSVPGGDEVGGLLRLCCFLFFFFKESLHRAWWFTAVILPLGTRRRDCEFEVSLGYIAHLKKKSNKQVCTALLHSAARCSVACGERRGTERAYLFILYYEFLTFTLPLSFGRGMVFLETAVFHLF